MASGAPCFFGNVAKCVSALARLVAPRKLGSPYHPFPVFAALVWDWYQVLLQGLTLVDVCALTWVRLLDRGLGSWEGGITREGEIPHISEDPQGVGGMFL